MFKQIQAVRSGFADRFVATESGDSRSTLSKGELLKVSGLAIPLDKTSANGRKYIAESVHAQVQGLQDRISKKALFGVTDHPPTNDISQIAYVKMSDVSHRIDSLWFNKKANAYYADITILDTPNGRILKTVHDSGSPLYISLRSLLDPARCVQKQGYQDAWMAALVTLDFVSQPGFADAELKAIDVASEAGLAVCEALDVFNQYNNMNKYKPVYATESLNGVATEPTNEFRELVSSFLTEALDKLPGTFTAADFSEAWPDSVYDHSIVGLYEDLKQIIVKSHLQLAVIALTSEKDGEYSIDTTQQVLYFAQLDVASEADSAETEDLEAEGMYDLEDTLDEETEEAKDNAEVLPEQMYTIVEDDNASVEPEPEAEGGAEDEQSEAKADAEETLEGDNAEVTEEPKAEDEQSEAKPEPKAESEGEDESEPKDEQPKPEDISELATEAARVFNMPNSRFAGIYAIEHMPAAFKHIWAGLSDAAKSVVAMQASQAAIANEADNLKFWHSTKFIAIESACLMNAGAVEAGLESAMSGAKQPTDPRTNFLVRCIARK